MLKNFRVAQMQNLLLRVCFKASSFLDRQYTVFGKVVEGMDLVDKIKRGDDSDNGSVSDPDKIVSFKSQ